MWRRCLGLFPEPHLDWSPHEMMYLKSDFQELIETRLIEIKRCSSIWKHNAKIIFQAFIYLLSVLELIFTLIYRLHNNFTDDTIYYEFCYNLSIISCVLIHSLAWMYTYHFKKVVQNSFFAEIANYIYYMFMGFLSYFKLAPFIIYYNRDQSIRQFSFSEINKYQKLSFEDKKRNPSRLFKDRKKPVNIFRDFIFHRVALLSMMITMSIQTIPQLFIQGFFNTEKGSWDGFNVFCILLLATNLIYYFFELQFIVFTTNDRQMQTDLIFRDRKIKLKFIQETKQLLKSNSINMSFCYSYYFHIDPSNFSHYQKKRCMIQIISYLLRYKEYKNLEFHFIDEYDDVTLQYLANFFKLIQVEQISLLYNEEDKLSQLEGIFNNIPNLYFQLQNNENLEDLWFEDNIDIEKERIQQFQIIENTKINAGMSALKHNQFFNNGYIQISEEFSTLIQVEPQEHQEDIHRIINEARTHIDNITKREIFAESVCKNFFLLFLYDFYQCILKCQESCDTFTIITQDSMNALLQILSLIYLTLEYDIFKSALIALTIFNVIFQPFTFALFQQRVFKTFSKFRKFSYILLYTILNTVKMQETIWSCFDCQENLIETYKRREFSIKAYTKFNSYASKFQGNIVSAFQFYNKYNDEDFLLRLRKNQPFHMALMWRANVQDTLNRIPQLFIYILSLSYNQSNEIWTFAFIQQIQLSCYAILDLLDITIKDFFIPALILSTSSVNQFLESIQYLSKISNQILLEYPKSFSIMSKVNEYYLKERCVFKINLKTLNFSNYSGLRKQKKLAQFRYVFACITNILEIDQAQRLLCMGSELNDLIRCLKVSPIYQLKLNYYLDEVNPIHIPLNNVILKNFPKKLFFLQLQVEATNEHQMEFCVERTETLIAFSYSYFQIIQQYRNNPSQVGIEINLNINDKFLKLDRYNFEYFYFDVSGNVILNNCEQLFAKFIYLKLFKATIINKAAIQTFQFSSNLKSKQLETLYLQFENIKLDFQEYDFRNFCYLKMILINCEFNKDQLREKLETLNEQTTEIYIDMSQCLQRFTRDEQRDLIKRLEQQGTDVVIKI